MIHVAYRLWGGDGFYAKMLGVSMLSMFENTKEPVTVHVMHNDRLTADNRGKFCYIAGQYNQRVEFHNVEEIAGPTLRKIEAVHPIESGINAAWYPLIIHEVFPDLDKIIFLGTDTVFNLDVAEIWTYDLDENDGYGIGAIPESCSYLKEDYFQVIVDGYVKYEDYFNVDVMLLKPSFFKDNFDKILEALKFVNQKRVESNSKYYAAQEQDALNYSFSKFYLKLPGKFNSIVMWKRKFTPVESLHIEKAIYHFADPSAKPSLDTDDVFNKLYLEYFLKTPWATADMFGNLDKILRKFYTSLQDNLLHCTNLLAQRQREFFIDKDNLELVKQIFKITNDERVIDSSMSEEKLIKELKKIKDKKVLFFFSAKYWKMRKNLKNNGFVEGVDFLNGFMFLSERYGPNFKFDTKSLVQVL